MPQPISKFEFRLLFAKCAPPQGWSEKLAVANSGGPDSTCLLFLLKRLVEDKAGTGLPTSVVSLTIDHGLQESSSAMADHCSRTSASLGVEHVTRKISWSQPPFPSKPIRSFEKTARDARYHLLFDAMTEVECKTIAFGHHADDQIETALLRMAKGTTEFGAAGMRPCRRWGMGFGDREGSLGWAGIKGMRRWIVRPLLTSRILATCEENDLDYVTDQTNFQPETTIRNAIRHRLSQTSEQGDFPVRPKEAEATERSNERTRPTGSCPPTEGSAELGSQPPARFSIGISLGSARLYQAVQRLSIRREQVDDIVTRSLKRCRHASPPSTVLFTTSLLHSNTDEAVQRAMVLRILRHVSFHPWGSVEAEAHRRTESLDRIVGKLSSLITSNEVKPFAAGGGVLWTPVSLRKDGRFKLLVSKGGPTALGLDKDLHTAWIASRQPPFSKRIGASTQRDPLCLDVSHLVSEDSAAIASQADRELLWDCRFLLRISIGNLAGVINRIQAVRGTQDGELLVEPETRWYLPCLVWRWSGGSTVLARTSWSSLDKHGQKSSAEVVDPANVVSIQEARVLDAL
ncbi:hypothetical protein OE88DRAFT_1623776 [Heliocybe sulcata]|uniref:tRNA(Ile)-lysidine synthetase n=1 Tax=Heliocybe sulcata TaxID=5364 RepID=A0A5C3NAG5_9AGAM|nr:hypothetical protein OE88DRAFT_1623776 [Heliocybe sulcata]